MQEDPLKENYDVLNKRIAALQKEIAEKEADAAKKVYAMRQSLRQEQAQLIRISDEMNRERKQNLAIHLTMDDSPCWMNDCKAECGGDFENSIISKSPQNLPSKIRNKR